MIALSPDDRFLASPSQDKTVRLWAVERGAPDPHARRAYCPRPVCGVVLRWTSPLEYADQAHPIERPEDRILFLGLNSCWQLDHHFYERASIHTPALARALDRLQKGTYDGWLKIAVWHHPVTGVEMMDDAFMQLLQVHGFQVCLHGHVHEAIEGFHKYDPRREMRIVGAGTFGAPAKEQVPGIPLQYNLPTFDPKTGEMTVRTRKKEKPNGAWAADARWGDKNDPKPWYSFQMPRWQAHN